MIKREDPLRMVETVVAITAGNLLLDKSRTCPKITEALQSTILTSSRDHLVKVKWEECQAALEAQ